MIIYQAKIAFYTRMNGKKLSCYLDRSDLESVCAGWGGERETNIYTIDISFFFSN